MMKIIPPNLKKMILILIINNDTTRPLKKSKITYKTCTVVKHIQGILPKILETLLNSRSRVRKELEQTTDPSLQNILNAKQLSLKFLLQIPCMGFVDRKEVVQKYRKRNILWT